MVPFPCDGYTLHMKPHVVDVKGLNTLACELAPRIQPKNDGATVVALAGDLGAGKTTFARAIARNFGIEEEVTSPTYVIEKIYIPTKGQFSRFIHIDAYRLHGAHDLDVLGWKDLLQEPDNLILIEWPEKVVGAIPADAFQISLLYIDENKRAITHDFNR
jgi:tRNA threonylcarbamoyladenosine biosynthesis protein TsaE